LYDGITAPMLVRWTTCSKAGRSSRAAHARNRRRADVRAAFGLAVAGHVLQCRKHPVRPEHAARALQAFDRGDAEFADEERVLAEGFLDAPPTRVACDVDDRRQHDVHAACARLASRNGIDAAGQVRVPRARHRDGLREHRRIERDVAVQGFFVEEHGDAEPRLLDGETLHGVDQRNRVAGIAAAQLTRRHRAFRIRRPCELADTVRKTLLRLRGVELQVRVEYFGLLDRTVISCATFSSRVMRASRSSTRASTEAAGFLYSGVPVA
jgi:hypothetical protein